MKNSEMRENRFASALRYKRMYESILSAIANGCQIQTMTQTHVKTYTKPSQFKWNMTGLYVQSGKNWSCINYTKVRAIK